MIGFGDLNLKIDCGYLNINDMFKFHAQTVLLRKNARDFEFG